MTTDYVKCGATQVNKVMKFCCRFVTTIDNICHI
jgi:hypothetical protein